MTVRNGRKYLKGDDKEENRPVKFKGSFKLVLQLYVSLIVHFVTFRPTETCKHVKKRNILLGGGKIKITSF
jgi:hypothetical protein